MSMIRSFVAVTIRGMTEIEHFTNRIGTINGIKGVKSENIHLTLKFLGNVDAESEVPEIVRYLTEVSLRHEPFDICFSGTGVFPNLKRIKILWIGIQSPELIELAQDVLTTLPGKENENTRPFSPHLTIGRVKFHEGIAVAKKLLEDHRDHDFGTIHVDRFELMKSTLTPQGPIYEEIQSFPLD